MNYQNHNTPNKFRISLFVFGIYLGFRICNLGFVGPALAQSSGLPAEASAKAGLAITPPVVEILLAPNKKITQAFQLTNQGESSQFVANLHLTTPTDSDGHVTVDPAPLDPVSVPLVAALANSDRKFGEPFTLPPGESTQLVLSLESASLDSNQDLYLALVISSASPLESSLQHLSSSVPALSALILTTLTPDGNLPLGIEVEGFDLPLLHDSTLPLSISASLRNTTATMLRPGGELVITSPRNNHSKSIKIYPNLILGLSSRTLTALNTRGDCPDPFNFQLSTFNSDSDCQVTSVPLVYQPHWYNLGPHRFTLTIESPGGSQITQLEKVVWLLPLRALLIFTLLAVITISLLLSAKKPVSPPLPLSS